VVERVPLAKKLRVGHLQFECVALKNDAQLVELPRRLMEGGDRSPG